MHSRGRRPDDTRTPVPEALSIVVGDGLLASVHEEFHLAVRPCPHIVRATVSVSDHVTVFVAIHFQLGGTSASVLPHAHLEAMHAVAELGMLKKDIVFE